MSKIKWPESELSHLVLHFFAICLRNYCLGYQSFTLKMHSEWGIDDKFQNGYQFFTSKNNAFLMGILLTIFKSISIFGMQ